MTKKEMENNTLINLNGFFTLFCFLFLLILILFEEISFLIKETNIEKEEINLTKCLVLLSLDLKKNEKVNDEKRENKKSLEFLNQHCLFDSLRIMPNSSLQNDSDFSKIVLIKDKICQIYKEHIKKSSNINNTLERLNNKDYIDSTSKNVTKSQLMSGMRDTIQEFSKWTANFINDLNGILTNKLNSYDTSTIITQANYILNASHFCLFVKNNESFAMLANGLQLSRNRLCQLFGKKLTDILFQFQNHYKQLDLSDNETALFNAFVLTSCNCKLVNNFNALVLFGILKYKLEEAILNYYILSYFNI
jgi:hypothetical protein